MKVSVSSNALCFVLGWIEGLPLFRLTGLIPPVEISKCLTRIKNDMAEAEFVASKDEELRRQDSAMAQMDKDARAMLSENMILRKELADIKFAKGKLESENITLRSVEVQLRKKLKEVNAQLDKLRMQPVQVGQTEKWTARVLGILDRIIADTETFGYDFGMSHVAKFAREAKMLIACGTSGSRNKAIPSLALLCEAFIGSTNPDKCDRVDVGVRLVNVLRACGLEVSE